MQPSLAVPAASPSRPKSLSPSAFFLIWAPGSAVPLMIGFVCIPMFLPFPMPIDLLVAAVLAALWFALIGRAQQAALKRSPGLAPTGIVAGWARRTMLGGALAIAAYVALLDLLGALYGDSPLLRKMSIFRPLGGEVQVATMLLGFVLIGAILSAAQWRPWAGPAEAGGGRRGVGWTLSGALGWGAGGVALWHVYESTLGNLEVYFEGLGALLVATLTALLLATAIIAVSGALALKNPAASAALSLLVAAGLGYLTFTGPRGAMLGESALNEPLFDQRQIHPQKSLGGDFDAHHLAMMDFSDDVALLAALVFNDYTQPGWPWLGEANSKFQNFHSSRPADPEIILWRTPDWKRVGVIAPGQTSASLEPVKVGRGVGAALVAEASPEYDHVFMRRADDKSLVATIDFRNPRSPLPKGFSHDTGALFGFGFVRMPDGKEYILSPIPVSEGRTWDPEGLAISPDGQYIANSYDTYDGCLVAVWALPHPER